jgi:hypothetical protein
MHTPWRLLAAICCVISIGIIAVKWRHELLSYVPESDQLCTDADFPVDVKTPPSGRLLLPTGVFVQSFAFLSSSDVNITGYIWHRYPSDWTLKRGFVLPERVLSADTVIEDAFTHEHDGAVVVGWYFDVTLRQPFDYGDYPFDTQKAWIRMWPAEFDKDIVLVPDFAAYRVEDMIRGSTFGVDNELIPGGWQMEETFFNYARADYDTNFGITEYIGQHGFPELHYTIVIRRTFRNVFIIQLIPLLVVTALLFSVLMTSTSNKDQADRFGFSAAGGIGTAAALFFVVIIAHVQVRQQFQASGLVYLEVFYLVTYVAILLVSLGVYLAALAPERRPRLIDYHDNAIAKLAYWPLILGTLAVVTLVKL